MIISISYNRKDHQIRFMKKSIQFIEECYGEFNFVRIGADRTRPILVFKPLKEETGDSYRLSKDNTICSVTLIKVLREISGHSGLYRYPLMWHEGLGLIVLDLREGVQQ